MVKQEAPKRTNIEIAKKIMSRGLDVLTGAGLRRKLTELTAKLAELKEVERTLEPTKKLKEEIRDIMAEIALLVATFEQGAMQREDMKKIESLRARLAVIYPRREECVPSLQEEIGQTITGSYTNLERLEGILRHLFPDLEG